MENLYVSQQEITRAISQFIANLQKAGLERRTTDYFKRRLDVLENYWLEYKSNHDRISELNIKQHDYFINLEYEQTKRLYISAKETIIKQSQEQTVGQASTSASSQKDEKEEMPKATTENTGGGKSSVSRTVSRGSTSKYDDLLRKQYVNFKALSRTVNNIQLDSINEKWEFEDVLKELQSRWTTIDSLHWEIYMESSREDEAYEELFTKHETERFKLLDVKG